MVTNKRSIFQKIEKDGRQVSKYVWEALPKELILSRDVSDKAYRLYSILTTYINFDEEGKEKAWPSFAELMEVTGWRKEKLSKAIEELVGTGWIGDIVSEQHFNYQNNYFLNNTACVNKELLARRKHKHTSQSKKAKARIAKKADLGSTENGTTPEGDGGSTENRTTGSTENRTTGSTDFPTRKEILKNQDLKNPILIPPASQGKSGVANAQNPASQIETETIEEASTKPVITEPEDAKTKLFKWVRTRYGLPPTPEKTWIAAFESAFNGTHKKSNHKAILPEHLLEMWDGYIAKQIFDRMDYRKFTRDMAPYNHSLYDLSCLIGEYDAFLARKEEAKYQDKQIEENIKYRSEMMNIINNLGKAMMANRKPVEALDDEEDEWFR